MDGNENRFRQQMEADTFIANNGACMRVININGEEWKRVSVVKRLLTELTSGDFQKSMTFLQKAGYIEIRTFSPERQHIDFCDIVDFNLCEVSLTAQGMRVASHAVKDPAVSM